MMEEEVGKCRIEIKGSGLTPHKYVVKINGEELSERTCRVELDVNYPNRVVFELYPDEIDVDLEGLVHLTDVRQLSGVRVEGSS